MRNDLLGQCGVAFWAQVPFETIWNAIIRVHPSTEGPYVEVKDGSRSWIEVPLTSGEHLVYEHPIGYWLISAADLARRLRDDSRATSAESGRARRYRHKAEELRTFAESMVTRESSTMWALADTYETLADRADGLAASPRPRNG